MWFRQRVFPFFLALESVKVSNVIQVFNTHDFQRIGVIFKLGGDSLLYDNFMSGIRRVGVEGERHLG